MRFINDYLCFSLANNLNRMYHFSGLRRYILQPWYHVLLNQMATQTDRYCQMHAIYITLKIIYLPNTKLIQTSKIFVQIRC